MAATWFCRHRVRNFDEWLKVYRTTGPMQKAAGIIAASVYQSPDDPVDITVIHEFASLEAAQTFGQSTEIKDAMRRAGVDGAPSIWVTHKVTA